MTQFGDEASIYKMTLMKESEQNERPLNDISEGYAMIEDSRITYK